MATSKDTLPPNNDPGANTSHLIADAFKDHSKGVNAVLFEIVQNSVDAYQYHLSEGNITEGLDIHFRVHPDDGTVEAWDNAGGMTNAELEENYLKLGNPGTYKIGSDTGGSQGKGFWAMSCWGTETYIHSLDQDGNEWCARAVQEDRRAERSDVKIVQETAYSPREELDSPGTYIRIEGLEQQTLTDLGNWDTVEEKLSRKFAFALCKDDINVNYDIVGDGEYTPKSYDLEKLLEQGGIVKSVDLEPFTKKGETRQLKSLYLIDHRQIPTDMDPPWKGVAMLKGGEFSDSHPYLSVWEYKPNNHPITREGKMWGWVDAGDLAPDLEEHGHTGFIGSNLYEDSGLRDAIFEASNKHFDNQTVEEQEAASEYGVETINHFMDEINDVDSSSNGSGGTGPETSPNEPLLRVNSGKHTHEEGAKVGVGVSVCSSKTCDIDQILVKGYIEKTTGADGEKLSEEERRETRSKIEVTKGDVQTPPGEYIEIKNGVYQTDKHGPGIYTFSAKLYEDPSPTPPDEPNPINFEYDNHLKQKPVLDTSTSVFNVGDIDTEQQPSETPDNDGGIVEQVGFDHSDQPWRVQEQIPNKDSGYYISINIDHPEYRAMKEIHSDKTDKEIQSDLGVKWGFLRIHFNHVMEDLEDLLDEHNINNSQVRSGMKQRINEALLDYDKFREQFIKESPLTDDINIPDDR